ncbi:MAG: hypothetical protein A2X23_11170 [Chloroflexi bacterium GWC2_73_18]|nr:MAG: hypothetical protein A2X23_11170 [Chloroflexi bacterium GWC2_73_18]
MGCEAARRGGPRRRLHHVYDGSSFDEGRVARGDLRPALRWRDPALVRRAHARPRPRRRFSGPLRAGSWAL